MPDIDERVVSMKFDNKQFEKGVQTSIGTLDKLKQSLKFNGVADTVSKTTSKISSLFTDMFSKIKNAPANSVQESLDFIANQVSNKGRVISNEIQRTVDFAENQFKRLYSFTIKDPFTDGFKEYELKMGSVQTIMNSTGESLDSVMGYLEELNKYADRTIYSFSDMTSSIGKFTNAGVKLDDAVAAIQGVSNVAAVSGANAEQASHAMYNFAQALSSGSVKLIDWKSIENANMATVDFKQTLLDSALSLGTVTKSGDKFISTTTDLNGKVSDAFDAVFNFNDSLSSGWMTTEVLVDALKKYTDETTEFGQKAFAAAQDVKTWSQLLDTLKEAIGSGWGTSFEIIIGNFEEAKEVFTKINNVLSPIIDKIADFRNAYLQAWVDNGGRERAIQRIESFLNALSNAVDKALEFGDTALKVFFGEDYVKFFGGLEKGVTKVSDTISKLISKEDVDRWQIAYDIWTKGTWGNGEERKRLITEHFGDDGESYKAIQDIIEDIIAGNVDYEQGLKDITDQYNKQNDKTKETTEVQKKQLSVQEKLTLSFKDIRISISNVIQTIKNLSDAIGNVIGLFIDTLGRTFNFQAIASDIKGVTDDLLYFSSVILDITKNSSSLRVIFTRISDTTNSVYSYISEFINTIRNNISMIFNTITTNEDFIRKITSVVKSVLSIINSIIKSVSNIAQAIVNIGSVIVDSFLSVFDFDKVINDISLLYDTFASFTEILKNSSKDTSKLRKFFDTFFKILNVIYSVISAIVKVVFKIGKAVFDTITNIIKAIKEFVANSGEDSLLMRGWTAIKKIFESVIELFKRIKDAFTEDVDGTGSLLDKILELAGTIGGGVLEIIVDLLESLANLDFSKLDLSWIDKIRKLDVLNLFGTDDANPFSKFKEWLKSAFSKDTIKVILVWAIESCNAVLNAIGSVDWSTIWSITSFFMFILIGTKIAKTLKSISGLMTSISNVTGTLSNTIKDIGNAVKTKILGSVFNTTLALIIGMFAVLIMFTELPQDKLINAATIMIAILIIIKDVVSKVLDTVSTTHTSNSRLGKLNAFMGSLAGIIASIAGVMIAIGIMGYIFDKTEHPIKLMIMSILMLVAVGGIIVGLLFALKKWGTANIESQLKGLANGLLGIGELVGILALVALVINKYNVGWDAIFKTLTLLVGVAVVSVGLMVAVKYFNKGAKKLKAFATGMILISVAIDTLIPIITALALISHFSGISPEEMMASMSLIILAMAGMVVAIGKATSGINSNLHKKLFVLAAGLALVLGAITAILKTGAMTALFDMVASEDGVERFLFILSSVTLALLAFVGVMALLAYALSKAPTMGATLVEMGIGFGLIGVGVLAAAAGILILIYSMTLLPEAADGIVAFVRTLEENGQSIVKFVTVLVIMIIAGILAAVAVMKGSMAVQVISVILYILVLAASFLHGHVHEAVDFLAAVIGDILLLLRGVTKVVAQGLLSLCILVIGELSIALIKKTPTILEILGKAISGIVRQIFSYLMGELFKGIGDLASALGELLMSSDITLFQTIGASANIWGVEAYETGREISKNLSDDAEANAAEIQEILDRESNAMETASGKMTEKIDKIKDTIMGKGEALTGSFGWAEGFDGGKVSGDINQMFNDPIGALTKGGNSFKFAADDASLNVLSGYGNLNNALNQQLMSYDEFKKQFEVFGKTYIDEGIIKKLYSEYSDESATGMSSLFDSLQNEKLMSGIKIAGINTGGDFVSGITEGIGTNIELPEGLDIYGIEGLDTEGVDFSQYGIDMSEDISEGAMYNEEAFEEAGNTTANVLMDNFENVSAERANKVGNIIAEQTSKGINENFEKNKSSVVSKADEYGRAVGAGIETGFKAKMEAIRRVANITGNGILTTFCDTLGIASPSKEMRKLGIYTLQGLIFGLRDEQSSLEQETSYACNSMIEALKSPMDFLISYFNGELEYDPSIRPTMDISGVRTGMTGINGMINGSTYQLGAEVSASMSQAALDKLDYATDIRNGFNDGNVINAIGKLNNDINTLNDSMSNMSVVMDTGALVGQLSEGMDYALGQRQYMRGRGM